MPTSNGISRQFLAQVRSLLYPYSATVVGWIFRVRGGQDGYLASTLCKKKQEKQIFYSKILQR